MDWGNLRNWLAGGSKADELAGTRGLWDEVQSAWRTSPAATFDFETRVVEIVREAVGLREQTPAVPVLVKLAEAAEALLRAEDFQPIEAVWSLIEADAAVGVKFRQMLGRRRRWAADFPTLYASIKRQLVAGYRDLIDALPLACFRDWSLDEGAFTVPLIELLDDPARVIEQLIVAPYDAETFRLDLFLDLREQLATNLCVASGFPPETNPHQVRDRLIMPTGQRGKSGRELADLYLAHTPFAPLMELPIPLAISDDIRFEHTHIIGGTGHGKTQFMQRMIHADLVAATQDRRSVVVIDSQGDLIAKLLRLDLFARGRPGNLADRLVLIDPADIEYPAALNLFDAHLSRLAEYRPIDRERVLNGVVELYETFFGAMLGAELTQKQGVIFKYLARLMVSIPGATIHTLMELMEDGRPFKAHMDALEGSACYFFETEFFHPSFAATKKQILKRLWGVLSTPAFERMFAQPDNKLDLFEALQDGKIILVSTAKDLLKSDGSALFGRFIIALLAQAALERSTIEPDERTPTFVYVDEAQEYFDDSVETILNQARKYRVGLTLAHQTLDQLSPRLRSIILSNTSVKCVGGVSSKDARALADELHTDASFIEGMRRRGDRTEFAVWLKNQTPRAVRLTVPLGFLERQPTLSEPQLDALIEINRVQYCGTLADIRSFGTKPPAEPIAEVPLPARAAAPPSPPPAVREPAASVPPRPQTREPAELGKGGAKHRYLQALVKQLAEQQGFRAVIEAPIEGSAGQVDVLLTQGDIQVAVEVSVSTPVEWERENLRKCLAAGYGRVALVLAKTPAVQGRYRHAVQVGLADEERARLTLLSPEDLPDFMANLAPPPGPEESIVRGYKVRVSQTAVSPEEARARRETLARLVAKSMKRQD